MKALSAVAKTLTLAVGFTSLIAIAETYYDKSFYTAEFMDDVQEVYLDVPVQNETRIVASTTQSSRRRPEYFPVEMSSRELIDGTWAIRRIINFNDKVVLDAIDGGDKPVKVNFKLISKGVVRIENDVEQTFYISELTREGTIALFKEYNGAFEIVEAIRISSEELASVKEESVEEKKETKNAHYHSDEDYVLVSALDPAKNRQIVFGEAVQGSAIVKNNELRIEDVVLHIGSEAQSISFSMDGQIAKLGSFSDGPETQGIITKFSKDEVQVRFSMGDLAGVMLDFATYEKRAEKLEMLQRNFKPQAPAQVQKPMNAQQEEPTVYANEENAEAGEEYYEEEYQEEYHDEGQAVEANGPEEQFVDEESEEYYEEVDGNRENIDERAREFQDFRDQYSLNDDIMKGSESEEERAPASEVKIESVGFSF